MKAIETCPHCKLKMSPDPRMTDDNLKTVKLFCSLCNAYIREYPRRFKNSVNLFNKDLHCSVISNLRAGFLERFPSDSLRLSDEEIWLCFKEGHGVETEGHEGDNDYAIYDIINDTNKAKKD